MSKLIFDPVEHPHRRYVLTEQWILVSPIEQNDHEIADEKTSDRDTSSL